MSSDPESAEFPRQSVASGAAPPPTVSLQPGQQVTLSFQGLSPAVHSQMSAETPQQFGDYDIVRKIAAGGMGVVYEARQRSLQRTVALKMIRSADLASEAEIARFYAEAEAAAGLRHPQIVAVYEVGRWGETGHYFTMDYIAGPSLAQVIRQQPLEPRRAAKLMAQVARAIHFAHEKGVLHRDLKPSNILLDEHEEPRVADFGLAKRWQSGSGQTIDGTVLGTPSYMAPEQARGESQGMGPASDVYSLGAVLYECLTTRPPFVAASLAEILRLVVEDEPLPPSRLSRGIPRDLETICLKCLEKDSAKRYASAAALADDLDRYLRDEPIQARPISTVERVRKFARRNPAWTALGGVVVGSLLTVLVISLWYSRSLAVTNAELKTKIGERDQALHDVKKEKNTSQTRYDSLRQTSYATSIKQADSYYSAIPPNLARADEMLQTLLPPPGEVDLRGPEWQFLQRAVRQDNLRLQTSDKIAALVVAPDGTLRVHCQASGGDWLVSLNSPASGKPGTPGKEPGRQVLKLTTSPQRTIFGRNGELFLAIDGNTGLQLRSTAQPDQVIANVANIMKKPGEIPIFKAVLSDDGSHVAWVKSSGEVHVWSQGEEREIKTIATPVAAPHGLLISPDNRYVLLFASDGGLLIDLLEDKQTNLKGEAAMISVAFRPDSKQLAIGYGTSVVDLLPLPSVGKGRMVSVLKFSMFLEHLEFAADGEKLIVGSPNCLLGVLDLKKNRAVVLRGHRSSVTAVRRGTVPHQFFTAGASGEVLAWDDRDEEQRATVLSVQPEDGPVWFDYLAYSPNGKYLLCGTRAIGFETDVEQGGLIFYDTSDLKQRRRWQTPVSVRSCSFTPDGQQVYWQERTKGKFEATFRRRPFVWQEQTIEPAAEDFVTDAAVVAAKGQVLVSDLGSIRLPEPGTPGKESSSKHWPLQSRRTEHSQIRELVASPNGNWLGSVENDFILRIWNVPAQRQVAWCPTNNDARAITFSADGRFAAWAAPDRLVLNLQRQRDWPVPPVEPAQWEPHHRAVVYNLKTEKIELIVSGHADAVHALSLSADGRRLLSGDSTGTVKLWDTTTGQELLSFTGTTFGISQVAIHPQGRQFATLGTDGLVRIWHCE